MAAEARFAQPANLCGLQLPAVPATVYLPLGSIQDFFYANAYLAIENKTNKTLTVYDGIDYGFNNYVGASEPLTWSLWGVGLALIGGLQIGW